MKSYNQNLFFLSKSPWPIFLSVTLFSMSLNTILFINMKNYILLLMNLMILIISMFLWWNDISAESNMMGFHNGYVVMMTSISMIFFIVSELFFFLSFFWTFLNSMLSLDIMTGANWPMNGIKEINYISLPLMNSILLISSGCSVTWSHFMIMSNKLNESKFSLMITIILGLSFMICQLVEYKLCYFCFSDGVFGSIFFISTGFHGLHVIIGSLFLFVMFMSMKNMNFSSLHIMGFEFSIWYWHFVDVVWLYLFMLVYWLGS